jgi:hypothetical protein
MFMMLLNVFFIFDYICSSIDNLLLDLMFKYILSVFVFFCLKIGWSQNVTISGFLKDQESKEPILFTKISIESLKVAVLTNEYGYFSLTVPSSTIYILTVSSAEFPPAKIEFQALSSVERDFFVPLNVVKDIQEVVIRAKKPYGSDLIKNTDVSVTRLDVKMARTLPALGGETDVIKVAQLLPGITRASEGGTNFFVRGGDGDQNLIEIDEAIVYNPGHLFGFFSVFNPDVIKEMTIYKGGFPANYSGRLSSITDIRTLDGNKEKNKAVIGIGMLSSRFSLEGPIWKNKISYLVAGRRSYVDRVFRMTGQIIPFYFYDFNAKVNYAISAKDQVYVSMYHGKDLLMMRSKLDEADNNFGFGYSLGNSTQTVRWNHVFNAKLFSNLSLIHTTFHYDIDGKFSGNNILIKSAIDDVGLKYNFQYYQNATTKVNFGIHAIQHIFSPNAVSTSGEISDYLKNNEGKRFTTIETNYYLELKKTLNEKWKFDLGLSIPQSFLSEKQYVGFSPRLNLAYQLNDKNALKLAASRMYQFMHRVSSSSVALPTDLWYPISKNIKPQMSDQLALAYNRNLHGIGSYLVLEGYYKTMNNLTEYKEGSQLIMNDDFESILVQGRGWSYGMEVLLKKDEGMLTGWIGYTLSWSKRKFDELNGGEAFWARYDRRHVASMALIYNLSERLSFSSIFEISTGARFTPIVSQYFQPNANLSGVEIIPLFAKRNSYVMSTSHRLDINVVIKSRQKENVRYYSEWTFGAYNVYNRAVPYQIKIVKNDDGTYKYTQPGLFGFIPSLGFNLKF